MQPTSIPAAIGFNDTVIYSAANVARGTAETPWVFTVMCQAFRGPGGAGRSQRSA